MDILHLSGWACWKVVVVDRKGDKKVAWVGLLMMNGEWR